jgi:hypothetical protein
METQAIPNLAQFPDEELFSEVAVGMDLVFENASAMEADAARLIAQGGRRGLAVLRAVADEEASKYLILLDAIRCPRDTNEEKKVFARHLKYFSSHLAKGIYAEYCYTSPVDFGEARRHVESCRPNLYLDGPEYTLWIFRNRISRGREGRLYVDYVETDNGRGWTTPAGEPEILGDAAGTSRSAALRLVTALQTLGMSSPSALGVIASVWRPIRITDEFHFSELEQAAGATLKALHDRGLLRRNNEAESVVVNRWLYPLYPLDLRPLKVDRSELREAQRAEADRFYEQF